MELIFSLKTKNPILDFFLKKMFFCFFGKEQVITGTQWFVICLVTNFAEAIPLNCSGRQIQLQHFTVFGIIFLGST